MLTEQQKLIVDQYKQSVAGVLAHNKGVMVEFAGKFQKPFKAIKIIVPGIEKPFWQIVTGSRSGFCVDGGNYIRYDFFTAPRIVSEELVVYPHDDRYGFPLDSVYISSTKIGPGGDSIYFSPEFDKKEVSLFLEKLQDKPDQPPAPHGIGWSDWHDALNERQDDIPY